MTTTKTWVRDRPVAVKVLSAVLLGVLALMMVGIYGVRSLQTVDSHAAALYEHAVVPYGQLADLRDMEGDTRVAIRDYGLATDAKQRSAIRGDVTEADAQLDATSRPTRPISQRGACCWCSWSSER